MRCGETFSQTGELSANTGEGECEVPSVRRKDSTGLRFACMCAWEVKDWQWSIEWCER